MFYTTIQLGEKQALTPEGFLIVYDVPIARTGEQMYAVEEFLSQGVRLEAADDGLVHVQRVPEEVFRKETLDSINGKAIVNEHPPQDLDPDNWRSLAMGIMINPRRGASEWNDTVLADWFVYDRHAIRLIRDERKREVSCGYTADYRRIGPGNYIQANIIVNHAALVKDARCGARCSIGDRHTTRGGIIMKWKDATAALTKLFTGTDKEKEAQTILNAVKVLDADESAEGGGSGEKHEIHIHSTNEGRTKYTDEALDDAFKKNDDRHKTHDAKFSTHDEDINAIKKHLGIGDSGAETKEIEGAIKEEAPAGTSDAAIRTGDSTFLRPAWQRTLSAAEVLVPGIRLTAYDATLRASDSYKTLCDNRRKVLQFATHDGSLRILLDEVTGGRVVNEKTVSEMKCAQVRDTFFALATARSKSNNVAVTSNASAVQAHHNANQGRITSIADLNRRKDEFYNKTAQ